MRSSIDIQLWILSSITLVCISVYVIVLSIWPSSGWSAMSSAGSSMGSSCYQSRSAYAIDEERHLQEAVEAPHRRAGPHRGALEPTPELSLLLQAGKAMNAALELDAVLDGPILHNALRL